MNKLFLWSHKFCKFSAFSLEFQNVPYRRILLKKSLKVLKRPYENLKKNYEITRTIYSNSERSVKFKFINQIGKNVWDLETYIYWKVRKRIFFIKVHLMFNLSFDLVNLCASFHVLTYKVCSLNWFELFQFNVTIL